MKAILAGIFAVALTCCSTTLYRDGKPTVKIYGNVKGLEYHDGPTTLIAAELDHSTPTTAAGNAIRDNAMTAAAAYMLKP